MTESSPSRGPTRPISRRSTARPILRWARTGRRWRFIFAVGPTLISALLSVIVFDGIRRAQESRALVAHTRDVIDRANAVLSTLQTAETGQRGYLLTGEARYLEPYERAMSSLAADTTGLELLVRGVPDQRARLDSLERAVHDKLDEMGETIALRRTRGADAAVAVVKTDRGKNAMDRIRRLIADVIAAERESLEIQQSTDISRGQALLIVLVAGTVISVVMGLLLNATLIRHADAESRLVSELEVRNTQLEDQALELEHQGQQLQDQAVELEMKNEELTTSSEALSQQAAELETQTDELEMANIALAEQTRIAEAARDMAEAANRTKSDFLAMMSHELRTPLNAIAGYTQLMQLGVPEPAAATHQEYLARIQHSQHHLLGVINSVLNLARIEAGSVLYDTRDVSVAELLDAVEPLVSPQLHARRHTYECRPCDPSLVVRADPEKATQVLLNLLSNAIKFTPMGGRITVSAEAIANGDERVGAIRVNDTGRGIPTDKLGTIFDPFVQVDASLSRTTDGAGLGLAISRELARGMGGDLTVESAVGQGSTFTFTLPTAQSDAASAPEDDTYRPIRSNATLPIE